MKREIKNIPVVLFTYGVFSNKEIKINSDHFDSCYLFKDTYSVEKDEYRYYCKNDSWYVHESKLYCLIIDLSKKDEALNCFFTTIKNKIISDIGVFEQHMKINQERLKKVASIELEFKIH